MYDLMLRSSAREGHIVTGTYTEFCTVERSYAVRIYAEG